MANNTSSAPFTARVARLTPTTSLSLLSATAPIVIGLVFAAAMQWGIGPAVGHFYEKVLTDVGIAIVLAVSLNLVNGFTGQFSIGHAGFMAVGGYTAGTLVYYGHLLLWGSLARQGDFFGPTNALYVVALLMGGAAAAIAGFVVGLPSLRLRGDYLAIVTLGFGEILRVLLQRSGDVMADAEAVKGASWFALTTSLGGSLGFTGLPFLTNLFWVWTAVCAVLLFSFRIKRSGQGRALLSIREDEIAAEAMGIPTTQFKVRAFVYAAFFAGIAGGLFAHEVGTTLNPRELGFQKSFEIVIAVVLGGMGSISGTALAAVILTILPELLRDPPHVWPVSLIVIVIIGVIRGREGVWVVGGLALATVGLEIVRYLAQIYGINLADYRMIAFSLALIVMMLVRPQGLFGLHEIWDAPALKRWFGSRS